MFLQKILSHPNKPLVAHLTNVNALIKQRINDIPLTKHEKEFTITATTCATLHDIGKATPFFQNYITSPEEERVELKNNSLTRHSLLGAILSFLAVQKQVPSTEESLKWATFAFLAVKHHHGNLDFESPRHAFSFFSNSELDVISKQINAIAFWPQLIQSLTIPLTIDEVEQAPNNIRAFRRKIANLPFARKDYFLFLYLYSLLIAVDKIEAAGIVSPERQPLTFSLVKRYRSFKGWSRPSTLINQKRNHFFYQAVDGLDSKKKIYKLDLPTGYGKTVTALAVALRIREEQNQTPRILYVAPFTTIIDQTYKVFEEVLKTSGYCLPSTNLLLKHHHLIDLTYQINTQEEILVHPSGDLLVEEWDAEIIVTTMVQFFASLISNKNRSLKKFHRLASSVIIFDELQALPSKYWRLFEFIMEILVNELNCFIILATATNPPLNLNAHPLTSACSPLCRIELIPRLEISSLEYLAEQITNAYKDKGSVCAVLNTIDSAKTLYRLLLKKGVNTHELVFLSSAVVPFDRFQRIKDLSTMQRKVVVSTQVIEAGVDLDFAIIYRDFAPFDSLIQSGGRCNRNFLLKKGQVYVVKLQDEKTKRYFCTYIYDPVLLEQTEKIFSQEKKKLYTEPEIYQLLNSYFSLIKAKKMSDTDILEAMQKLNFDKLAYFNLIEEQTKTVNCYIELNDEATRIWQEFEKIKKEKNFIKRKELFHKIKGQFFNFVISVNIKNLSKLPQPNDGLIFISKDMLSHYYDKNLGFEIAGGSLII